ncbi:sensor histidine kinase [Gracilimonas sediminicola]|uniref:sensor histidine kinase n=1 Tax=Gracilimonas sediminicola TaxID=2952158 RepID=UPI0025464375|nr:ATP-binding protein [Gracilimonas sediminicola]
MDDYIVKGIQSFPQFSEVPEDEIREYVRLSEVCTYQPDEVIVKPGDEINKMYLLLEGNIRLQLKRGDQFTVIDTFEAGDLTGKLPFSRLQSSLAYVTVIEESTVLITHEDKFPEIASHYQLIESFVHALSDRIRHFTTQQQQNEKLLALGKLSAGLAHELNNPASAMVRSATSLKANLHAKPEKFKGMMELKLSEEQVDAINKVIFNKLNAEIPSLSLMERTSLEDDLADWMEDHGIEETYELAETFAEHGFNVESLEQIKDIGDEAMLTPVFKWIEDVFVTEKMIAEVEDASRRISDLVSSVKTYSHMDQANEKQPVELEKLLKSTLSILNHQIKEKQVSVELNIPDDLPEFCGFVSELNQVWMNLLDNAVDAIEKEGRIEISAEAKNGDLRIYFKDNGAGIPEDIHTKIFDPFFTTKGIGEGTGLGLDFVRKIVNKHNGTITVQSKPGETIFELCFPLK